MEDIQLSVEQFLSDPFEEKVLEHNIRTVFHYTTAEGLKGIIDSDSFYVSKSDFLNDYTEIQYCWDLLLHVIDSLIKECTLDEKLVFYEKVKQEAKLYRVEVNEQEEIFVLSFTKNGDSLAMWSQYSGSDGYNIAIDLKTNVEEWKKLAGIHFRYGAVIYSKEEQQEILKEEINKSFLIWNGIEGLGKKWDYLVVDALLYRIKIWTMFFKNSLFKEEQEVRVAFFRANYEQNIEKLIVTYRSMYPEYEIDKIRYKVANLFSASNEENSLFKQFRVRNNIIYPFVKVDFDIKSLVSVRVGPINKFDKAVLGIKMYLDSKGLKERNVDRSECPLRF